MSLSPLTLLLLLPLGGIIALIAKAPAKPVALLVTGLNLLISGWILTTYRVDVAEVQFVQNIPWIQVAGLPEIRFHVGVDGLNLPLLLLTTLVSLTAVMVSPAQLPRAKEFYSYLLLMIMGAIGAFISLDLFFCYVFHELALVPTFILMSVWGFQHRHFLAMQMALYLMLGSLFLLAGLIALVMALPESSRTFDLLELQQIVPTLDLSAGEQGVAYGLLMIGFGITMSLFPFHTWAPQGYAACPPAVAMLHAGVLKVFGVYGLIRIAVPLLPVGAASWEPVLIILVGVTVLFLGYAAIAQREVGTILGYANVMHMACAFLGIIAWNQVGVSGAVLFLVGHGLSAALLFALAGALQTRTGETRLTELGGLARQTPFLAVAFIVGAFAAVGLPGLAPFSGEVLLFFGSFRAHPWLTTLCIFGAIISAVFLLRLVKAVFLGPPLERFSGIKDLSPGERVPYGLLLGALLLLGFVPEVLLRVIQPTVARLLGG
jgi:NADH-quinone oxidoreductase subunit M